MRRRPSRGTPSGGTLAGVNRAVDVLSSRWARLPVSGRPAGYAWSDLRADVLAGAVVAALAIPQALGYAAVAGVGIEVGLYTLPPALLAYAVLGSSRLLMVGPVSTVAIMSGSLVALESGGDPTRAAELTSGLALAAGLILVGAGMLRLGWLAEFMSEPITAGFITGLVALVVVAQVPAMLGLDGGQGDLWRQAATLRDGLSQLEPATPVVAALALTVLFGGQRLAPRVPWSLVVLIAGILASRTLDLSRLGVSLVDPVPGGLEPPRVPSLRLADLPALASGGLAIALVGLAEGLAAARLFATRRTERLDTDQELLAHGAADLAAGLAGGMGAAGSLSKTAAADQAGCRSQLTGVVTALAVVGVLLGAAPLASSLPSAVLGAIVVHAVWGLVHPHAFARYRRIRRNDGIAAVVALVGVLVLGPLNGLLAAIGQSLLGLLYRSAQVGIDEMGKVPDEKAAWGSVDGHPERRTTPGVLVLRLNAPLFWVNATTVVDRLLAITAARPDVRVVVLDLEASNQLDVTAERRLTALLAALRAQGRDLYLVRVFDQVRVVLGAAGFFDLLGPDRVWHSISAGVRAAKHAIADGAVLPEGWDAGADTGGTDDHDHHGDDDRGDDDRGDDGSPGERIATR